MKTKQVNTGNIPKGFPPSEIADFRDFVSDHIKQCNSVPLEYETKDGVVWGVMDTWNLAVYLCLTDEIDKPALY